MNYNSGYTRVTMFVLTSLTWEEVGTFIVIGRNTTIKAQRRVGSDFKCQVLTYNNRLKLYFAD